MRALAAAAVIAVTALAPGGAARAAIIGPGTLCSLDTAGLASVQTGVLAGGPLTVLANDAAGQLAPAYLTCTVQVGYGNSTHAGADAAIESGPTTTGEVALEPTPISYSVSPLDPVYVCTRVTVPAEGVYYFDDYGQDDGSGAWTTSATAHCRLAETVGDPYFVRVVPPYPAVPVLPTCYTVTVNVPPLKPSVTVCNPL